MAATPRANRQSAARVYIPARAAFQGSNLRGEAGAPRSSHAGYLPAEWREDWYADYDARRIVYAVYSYATPIAWVLADGECVIPAVKYSRTTSVHQGLLYGIGGRVRRVTRLASMVATGMPEAWAREALRTRAAAA